MPNYSSDKTPWYNQRDKIKKVIIENGVTNIGDFAFMSCRNLTSVNIPNSVTRIGGLAFSYCSGLVSIAIPNSVTRIGEQAFLGTKWYNNLPDGVVYAGKVLYKYKGSMPSNTKIDIKKGTKEIGASAFSYCSGLASITIPNSVTSIGSSAFKDCNSITSVTIPNGVTSIEENTFSGCSALASITIPNSVTNIGDYAFNNCSNLTSITIPNSVKSIGEDAFENCNNLKKIIIGKSVESIGKEAFRDCYNLQSITINNPEPPVCESLSTFTCSTSYVRDKYDVYTYATLHIPMGSKEAYSSANEWRYFNKIKEDMEIDGKVYYVKLAVKQGTTGYTEQPVKADETYTIYIGALGNSKINAVTFNGEDVTNQVKDGYYTTPEIKAKSTLSISYEDINTTNVKEIGNPELKVTGNDGEINISGIDNPTDVEVYTTDGKLVESKGSVYGDTSIQVKEDELYLVKVGKRAIKIAM